MTKAWETMTNEEKIEDLRHDMIETMKTVNFWVKNHLNSANLAFEVAAAVRSLEQRIAKLDQ